MYPGESGWQIGHTKVFMKYWLLDRLASQMEKMHKAATVMEKFGRGMLARKKVKELMAVARQEADRVRNFTDGLSKIQYKTYDRLEVLCDQDMQRYSS